MKRQPRPNNWLSKETRKAGQSSSLLQRSFPSKGEDINPAQGHHLNTLIALFLFASAAGWVFEIVLYLVNDGVLVNPGFLYGPWTPIYGVCCVGIALIFRGWNKNPIVLFVLVAALCGTIEFITGSFLEYTTGAKWWDYSNHTFNLGGFVCLEALALFGALGLLLIYVIVPACERKLLRVPLRTQQIIFGIVLTVFFIDALYSLHQPNLAVYVDVLSQL